VKGRESRGEFEHRAPRKAINTFSGELPRTPSRTLSHSLKLTDCASSRYSESSKCREEVERRRRNARVQGERRASLRIIQAR
jgi:hypothetical protein